MTQAEASSRDVPSLLGSTIRGFTHRPLSSPFLWSILGPMGRWHILILICASLMTSALAYNSRRKRRVRHAQPIGLPNSVMRGLVRLDRRVQNRIL